MRIEDMKNWSVDQLKKEVVRLSEECEKKQHEILDKDDRINGLQTDLDNMFIYCNKLKKKLDKKANFPFGDGSAELNHYQKLYQASNVRINELTITINTLVDMLADLRNALELRETCN